MGLLKWDKPKQVASAEEWNKEWSSSAEAPGTYVPNMSEEDRLSWKAELQGTRKPPVRVTVRKTTANGVQMKMVVFENHIDLSMNGSARLSNSELTNLSLAVSEARSAMREYA